MDYTFGGDQFNANESIAGASAKSDQKAEGMVPVFIKQILISPEVSFRMFGITFGMVKCIAIVRAIDTSSTKITYSLEDFTGQIEAHCWIEEGDSLKAPDVMINNYARVYGSIRTHGAKKSLMVFKMAPIGSFNELNTHMLDVLLARYKAESYFKKGPSEPNEQFPSASSMMMQQDSGNNLGLTGKTLVVYQAIKMLSEKGDVSTRELQTKFTHMSLQELRSILDSLSSEGHIYATLDSDHFLCTDA